jgi:hypothetical protein
MGLCFRGPWKPQKGQCCGSGQLESSQVATCILAIPRKEEDQPLGLRVRQNLAASVHGGPSSCHGARLIFV